MQNRSKNLQKKLLSKISMAVVFMIIISLLMPVFSYAMIAVFNYNKVTHELTGSIYTKDPNSVHMQVNSNGVLSTLNGSTAVSNNTYNDQNLPYYSINYQTYLPLKPDNLILSESTYSQPNVLNGIELDENVYYQDLSHDERSEAYRMTGTYYYSNYKAQSFLQPSSPIMTFTPTQSLGDTVKVYFPQNSSSSTQVNLSLLTPQSLSLIDNTLQTNVAISKLFPVYEFDYVIGEMKLNQAAIVIEAGTELIAGHSYTLKMSETSHGTEIQLPKLAGSYNASAFTGGLYSYYQYQPKPSPTPTATPAGYGSITGSIKTYDQTPLSGVDVFIYSGNDAYSDRPYVQKMKTEADGLFTFHDMPAGPIYFKLVKAGFISDYLYYAEPISPNHTSTAVFGMLRTSLYGYVKDESGEAIEGAQVSINDSGLTNYTMVTGSNGFFSYYNLPNGNYSLTVSKATYQNVITPIQNVYEGYSTAMNDINMRKVTPVPTPSSSVSTVTVKGIFKDSLTHQRVSGVHISMYSGDYYKNYLIGTTVTDAEGTYSFNDVPVGYINMAFDKDGYISDRLYTSIEFEPYGISSLGTFELVRSRLTGVIKDANHIGIPNAYVNLEGTNYQVKTDVYGYFYFTNAPDGNYRISVSKKGYDTLTTPNAYNVHQMQYSNAAIGIYMVANSELQPEINLFYDVKSENSIFFDQISLELPVNGSTTENPPTGNPGPGGFMPPIIGETAATPTVIPAPTEAPDLLTMDSSLGARITTHATPEKTAAGRTILNIVLDSNLIHKALEQLKDQAKDKQRLTVDTGHTNSDISNISLSANLLADMIAYKDVMFTINLDDITYELPLKLLNLEALSQTLGSDASDASINITIEKISGAPGDKMHLEARAAGFEPLGNAIDFRITVEAGGVKKEINNFGHTYVSRTVMIPQRISKNAASAVWYDPATGKFSFVPATFDTVDGKTTVTIKRNGNSQYLIINSDKSFLDTVDMYATDDINLLASKLIVNGVTANQFKPYDKITRAQFTALLVRGLGLTLDSNSSIFSDIKTADWYAEAVNTAVKAGLIIGFEDGTFRPNESITREQMASLIAKALVFTGQTVNIEGQAAQITNKFKDKADISLWAVADTAKVIKTGIMQGNADSFTPKAYADRAQAVVTLKRLLEYLQFIN